VGVEEEMTKIEDKASEEWKVAECRRTDNVLKETALGY
jgi:hypothetical protein